MLPVNIAELSQAHIQRLIDSEVPESLTLEYKQELPPDQTDAKRKFVCTVAAMANTAGGDIVVGIVDRKGDGNQSTRIPQGLAGMKMLNPQADITRLSNLIKDGISPRLTGVAMQPISCVDGDILLIRVPRSWNKPLMVTLSEMNKFFARSAVGRYPMSIDEIGRSFSEQSELGEKIQAWRSHRAKLIEEQKGPVRLAGEVTMMFHAIPSSAFSHGVLRETWRMTEEEKNYIFVPHGAYHLRYNADGCICLSQSDIERNAT